MDPPTPLTSEQLHHLEVAMGMQLYTILNESSHCGERSCGPALAGRSCSPVDRRARKQKKKARTEEGPRSSTATSSPTARPENPSVVDIEKNELCEIYRCSKCCRDFHTMFAYREHLNHAKTHLTCWRCGTVFVDHRVFLSHLTTPCKTNVQVLMSRRLSAIMEMAWKTRRTRWVRQRVLRVLFQCPLCPKRLGSKSKVKRHLLMKRHNGYRTLACKYCKRQITVKVSSEGAQESIACPGCGFLRAWPSA